LEERIKQLEEKENQFQQDIITPLKGPQEKRIATPPKERYVSPNKFNSPNSKYYMKDATINLRTGLESVCIVVIVC
jgi:hypothetical protein